MENRTTRTCTYNADFWSLVEKWAAGSGFALLQQKPSYRIYRKGQWMLLGPTCLEIRQKGETVTLETWIKADFYLIMALMTGKPSEAALDSGGLTAWLPRKRARKAVNPLLVSLGLKPIA